jgi:glycosyltransferase involved in cell wall biosynthesis
MERRISATRDIYKRQLRHLLYKVFGPGFKLLYRRNAMKQAAVMKWDGVCWGSKKGLVSVVLPVYNQARFLESSINSVLEQTYGNFELIIVNDGSTDGVEHIFEKYLSHPKVLLLTQRNQKLPAALNTGFLSASGEFLTWTSADNIMFADQLAAQVRFLKTHPHDQMVYCNYQAIDDEGHALSRKGLTMPGTNVVPTNEDVRSLPYAYNFIAGCFMYRSYVARIIGDYDADAFGAEDYDYWIRLSSDFYIEHIGSSRPYYTYRIHQDSIRGRQGESSIANTITEVQHLNDERQILFRSPMIFFVPSDGHFSKEVGSVRIARAKIEVVRFRDSRMLDTGLADQKAARKKVVFLKDNQIRDDSYFSVIRRRSEEDLLFVYAVCDNTRMGIERTEEIDRVIITGDGDFPFTSKAHGNRFICVPNWEEYLPLWSVIANHGLFGKATGRKLFGSVPEHDRYGHESS